MPIGRPAALALSLGGVSLIALGIATEVSAWRFGWHPSLGSPLSHLGMIPLYWPWSIVRWLLWWGWMPPIKTGVFAGVAAIGFTAAMGIARMLADSGLRGGGFGAAEWGDLSDAKNAGLLSAKPTGTVLGTLGGLLLTYSGDEHQLVAGAAGSGKTVNAVISSLLTWTGSVLVYDPKRELYAQTAKHRTTLGETWFFDPTSPDSCCFNPLWEIRTGTAHETGDVQNLVGILIDPDGSMRSADYWDTDAAKLLTALVLYSIHDLPRERQALATLNDLLLDIAGTLTAMAESSHPKCRQIGGYIAALPSKQLSGVHASAGAKLILYDDPIVAEKTSRSDFTIADLVCGERPASCYLQLRPTDAVRCRPLTRLILTQVAQQLMYDVGAAADGQPKRYQLLYLLEEFPSLGRLDFFSSQMRVMRGYGITALLIVQSFKDLINAYGRDQTIVDNCRIVVAFAASDPDTLKYISVMCGSAIETKQSETRKRGSWFERSLSTSEHRRPLLEEGQVRQLPYDEELVLVTGAKPFRAKKVRWFDHLMLSRRGTNLRKGGIAPGQNPRFVTTNSTQNVPQIIPDVRLDLLAFIARLDMSQRKFAAVFYPALPESTVRACIAGTRAWSPDADRFIKNMLVECAKFTGNAAELRAWLTSNRIEQFRNKEAA